MHSRRSRGHGPLQLAARSAKITRAARGLETGETAGLVDGRRRRRRPARRHPVLIRRKPLASASPMLPHAEFQADVILIAPKEFEATRSSKTYREKNFTTFTELLSVSAFQTDYIKRINEALGLEALASYLEAAGIRVAIL